MTWGAHRKINVGWEAGDGVREDATLLGCCLVSQLEDWDLWSSSLEACRNMHNHSLTCARRHTRTHPCTCSFVRTFIGMMCYQGCTYPVQTSPRRPASSWVFTLQVDSPFILGSHSWTVYKRWTETSSEKWSQQGSDLCAIPPGSTGSAPKKPWHQPTLIHVQA